MGVLTDLGSVGMLGDKVQQGMNPNGKKRPKKDDDADSSWDESPVNQRKNGIDQQAAAAGRGTDTGSGGVMGGIGRIFKRASGNNRY